MTIRDHRVLPKNQDGTDMSIPEQLRFLCGHLVDHGKIELGTVESKILLDVARKMGAWQA